MPRELDPVVSIRIPRRLLAEVDEAVIKAANKLQWRRYRYKRTHWIIEAIRMRLGKGKGKWNGKTVE